MPMHFIKDLNMRQITEKFVPQLLNNDQKQNQLCVQGWELQDKVKKANFLSKVIPGD
jgi:hypothetical protein